MATDFGVAMMSPNFALDCPELMSDFSMME
jgi:hypothetical protein